MNYSAKQIVAMCAGVLVAGLSFWVLSAYTSNTIGRVVISGKFPVGTHIQLKLFNPWGANLDVPFEANESDGSVLVRRGTVQFNFSATHFELWFSNSSENVAPLNIYNIQIERPYASNVFIGQNRLRDNFSSLGFGSNQSALVGWDQSRRVLLLLKNSFQTPWSVGYLVLSLVFGIAVFLLMTASEWRKIPAFHDMQLGNKISTAHEFNSVNGLRGLAALLVLLSHTAPGFFDLQLGLTLLFVFSGFLLSKPFVLDQHRIFRWEQMRSYLTKRLKRILPVYYLYVFVVYIASFKLDIGLRHLLFVQGEGHLWPMTQIFTFYMLLPVVLLLTSLSARVHRFLPELLLIAGIAVWLNYAGAWKPYYNGQFSHEFYLHAFLIGVLGSYLQYDAIRQWAGLREIIHRHRQVFASAAFVVVVLTVAWSGPVAAPAIAAPFIAQFYVKCLLSVLIILLAINIQGTWFNRLVSNWFLRSMGIVGFSFYIWHGMGIELVQQFQIQLMGITDVSDRSWSLMLSALAVTYVLALLSYSWVERPFFGYREEK